MGFNWDAVVVRAADEAALAKVKEADPKAIALPGGFARLRWDGCPDWTRSGTTRTWSKRFGEAWYFNASSGSDSFAHEHGRDGEVVRSLAYAPDEGWLLVEGTPNAWEEILFRPRQLDACRGMLADEPGNPRWKRELEALEAKQLVVGHAFPQADADLAHYVAKQLGTQLVR